MVFPVTTVAADVHWPREMQGEWIDNAGGTCGRVKPCRFCGRVDIPDTLEACPGCDRVSLSWRPDSCDYDARWRGLVLRVRVPERIARSLPNEGAVAAWAKQQMEIELQRRDNVERCRAVIREKEALGAERQKLLDILAASASTTCGRAPGAEPEPVKPLALPCLVHGPHASIDAVLAGATCRCLW